MIANWMDDLKVGDRVIIVYPDGRRCRHTITAVAPAYVRINGMTRRRFYRPHGRGVPDDVWARFGGNMKVPVMVRVDDELSGPLT